MKFRNWNRESLLGKWIISRKIDGVRVHKTDNGFVTRSGKPLNLKTNKDFDVAEAYCEGGFKETISILRSLTPIRNIREDEIYTIKPLDARLKICEIVDPTTERIDQLFKEVRLEGFEGLILNNGEDFIKVKESYTFDTKVISIFEGKGKHSGRLGGLVTEMGKVGTGFTDKERVELFSESVIGTTIEVECMELTPDGKFRHPRFIRLRPDK